MLSYAFLAAFILFSFYIHRCNKNKNRRPPGPIIFPILGSLVQFVLLKRKYKFTHLTWRALVEKYGPIVNIRLGKTNIVLVSSLSLVKEVGLNEALQGRPDGFFYRKRSLGHRGGLVFSEGPVWAEQRRFCLSHLRYSGLNQDIMEKLISDEAEHLLEWLNEFNEKPMLMDTSFLRFVLNIIWSIIAGKRFDRNNPILIKICNVIDRSFRRMNSTGSIINQLPSLRFIAPKISGYLQYCQLQNELIKFIKKDIEEHKLSHYPNKDNDLIDAILHQIKTDNEHFQFTENDLFVICLDLLQAGTDTTSSTLSFIMVYLMYNQKVQQKVHAEIDEVIGSNRKPTLQDRQRMPYTMAVIEEVQRLGNIAPGGVPHRATKDTTLGQYNIPKDTVVICCLYEIHKNNQWNDPDIFRPERFLDDTGKLITHDSFIPFGFGKRKCVGEVLAKANLFLFSCYIFQHFYLLPTEDCPSSFEILDGMTLSPAPFKAIWKRRNIALINK